MASANEELVRSIYADWERGDWTRVDWAAPEFEFVIADGPTPGTWTGPAGVSQGWGDFLSAWEEFQAKLDEVRELDDARVLALAHFSARGKSSGLEADDLRTEGAGLFEIRDGKVTRLVFYLDRARALAELDSD